MEEGLHLAQCQQGRLLFCRLGEVHHHRDVRTDVLALLVDILSLIFRHPGTALLALAGVEISVEDGEIAAILVEHLVSLDVRMVNRNVLVLLEGDAVQLVGKTEDTAYHLRQFEVGTQHFLVDVVLLHLQLVTVETSVPRLHLIYIFVGQLA